MSRKPRSGGRRTRNCRALAAQTLHRVAGGQSLNQCLPEALTAVSDDERALMQELCYGTLRLYPRLAALVAPLLDKPLRDKDGDVFSLLLLGVYQLSEMRIPAHAAVSTAVDATRELGKPWAKGLCNAVLRRFQREASTLLEGLDAAAVAAHPQWLFEQLHREWPDAATKVIAANNQRPPMTLRVNRLRVQRDQYLAQLAEAEIRASAGEISDDAIYLQSPVDVAALPGFNEGLCSVQDEAAQLAAILLACQPGDRVLDACAAPGGKSCHLLERYPDISELVAVDSDPVRLQRVADNAARLSLTLKAVTADAAEPPSLLEKASFDRILVDAPCSASGVIRRHPDIKLLRRASDAEGFAAQQSAILAGVWPLLKPGGSLLYATCSVLGAENDEQVERFLAANADATLDTLPGDWGEATRFGRQLLPSDNGPDGLYYAMITKAD